MWLRETSPLRFVRDHHASRKHHRRDHPFAHAGPAAMGEAPGDLRPGGDGDAALHGAPGRAAARLPLPALHLRHPAGRQPLQPRLRLRGHGTVGAARGLALPGAGREPDDRRPARPRRPAAVRGGRRLGGGGDRGAARRPLQGTVRAWGARAVGGAAPPAAERVPPQDAQRPAIAVGAPAAARPRRALGGRCRRAARGGGARPRPRPRPRLAGQRRRLRRGSRRRPGAGGHQGVRRGPLPRPRPGAVRRRAAAGRADRRSGSAFSRRGARRASRPRAERAGDQRAEIRLPGQRRRHGARPLRPPGGQLQADRGR